MDGGKKLTEGKDCFGPYLMVDAVGRGAFGVVFKAVHQYRGNWVAIKRVAVQKRRAEAQLASLMSEIDLLKALRHRNIVEYIDHGLEHDHLYIVMEYVEAGSLFGMVKRHGRFPEPLVAAYVRQVLHGLRYLHEVGVIHRDIKGANILVSTDGTAKLADFGVSTRVTELTGDQESFAGTPYWMAPEVISMGGVTTACDIWSIGCTIIELLTGEPPYSSFSPTACLYRIVQDDHPPLPDGISPPLHDLLMQCFQKDVDRRIDASRMLTHAWIRRAGEADSTVDAVANRLEAYNAPSLDDVRKPPLASSAVPPVADPRRRELMEPLSVDHSHQGQGMLQSVHATTSGEPSLDDSGAASLLELEELDEQSGRATVVVLPLKMAAANPAVESSSVLSSSSGSDDDSSSPDPWGTVGTVKVMRSPRMPELDWSYAYAEWDESPLSLVDLSTSREELNHSSSFSEKQKFPNEEEDITKSNEKQEMEEFVEYNRKDKEDNEEENDDDESNYECLIGFSSEEEVDIRRPQTERTQSSGSGSDFWDEDFASVDSNSEEVVTSAATILLPAQKSAETSTRVEGSPLERTASTIARKLERFRERERDEEGLLDAELPEGPLRLVVGASPAEPARLDDDPFAAFEDDLGDAATDIAGSQAIQWALRHQSAVAEVTRRIDELVRRPLDAATVAESCLRLRELSGEFGSCKQPLFSNAALVRLLKAASVQRSSATAVLSVLSGLLEATAAARAPELPARLCVLGAVPALAPFASAEEHPNGVRCEVVRILHALIADGPASAQMVVAAGGVGALAQLLCVVGGPQAGELLVRDAACLGALVDARALPRPDLCHLFAESGLIPPLAQALSCTFDRTLLSSIPPHSNSLPYESKSKDESFHKVSNSPSNHENILPAAAHGKSTPESEIRSSQGVPKRLAECMHQLAGLMECLALAANDTAVLEPLCEPAVLGCVRRVVESGKERPTASFFRLLQCVKVLSQLPAAVEPLGRAGFVETLVALLARWTEFSEAELAALGPEQREADRRRVGELRTLQLWAMWALSNLCAVSRPLQERAALAGAVPQLVHYYAAVPFARMFSVRLLLLLPLAGPLARAEVWNHADDVFATMRELLSNRNESYFVDAIRALERWADVDAERLAPRLAADATVELLLQVFDSHSSAAFAQAVESLQRLVQKVPALACALAALGFARVLAALHSDSTLVVRFVLAVIRDLLLASSPLDRAALAAKVQLASQLEPFVHSADDRLVLARQIASTILSIIS